MEIDTHAHVHVIVVRRDVLPNEDWEKLCRAVRSELSTVLGIAPRNMHVYRQVNIVPGTDEEVLLIAPDRGTPANHDAVFMLQRISGQLLNGASVQARFLQD